MLIQKITSSIATGAILLNTLIVPAFAASEIDMTGNGAGTTNSSVVTVTNTTVVDQTNVANVTNTITSTSSSGNNIASGNTGGDSLIRTGDIENKLEVVNQVNANKAMVENPGTVLGDLEVNISENGANSENTALVESLNDVSALQQNIANVTNDITALSNSGLNEALGNTGGKTAVVSGDVKTEVAIENKANINVAEIENAHSAGDLEADIKIEGNGRNSVNQAFLTATENLFVDQDNEANIDNIMLLESESGFNLALDNTGADSVVESGDTKVKVEVDNMVNLNFAAVDSRVGELSTEISENGVNSVNDVTTVVDNILTLLQGGGSGNSANLLNDVVEISNSGANEASGNTGDSGDTFGVLTGDMSSEVDVENSGNVNVISPSGGLHLSGMDHHFIFHFDFDGVLDSLHLI